MGRKSVITEIESKYHRPIMDVLTELAAQGDANHIKDQLGVSLRTVYNLCNDCGIRLKSTEGGTAGSIRQFYIFSGEIAYLVDSFLVAKEVSGLTKASLSFYKLNLQRFLWWLDQEHIAPRLESFNPDNIRQFLLYVQNNDIRFGGKSTASRRPVTRSTVDAYWRTFQSFATWLVKEGHLDERANPIRNIPRPKQVKTVIPEVPPEILEKIVKSFDSSFLGKRNRAIFMVILDIGLRLNELVGMQLRNIQLDTGLVKVLGKGQKERVIPLSPLTMAALKVYLKSRNKDNPDFWQTPNGESLTRSGMQSLIKRWARFGPPGMHLGPHAFRHTFAIHFLRGGGNPYTLKELGGWTDLDIPLGYSQAAQRELALKDHQKASPVMNLFGNGKSD